MAEENNKQQQIQIPAEKLVDALLHARQFEQHYATQESVDNLRVQINEKFSRVDERFVQMEKRLDKMEADTSRRFDKLETKFDRLQWFIVAAALALIFKDYLFKMLGA